MSDIVQIIPAVGWYAVYEGTEGEEPWRCPLACWGLCGDSGKIVGLDTTASAEGLWDCSTRADFLCYEHESDTPKAYTVFCRDSEGDNNSTTFIESAEAGSWEEAAEKVRALCAESWGYAIGDIRIVGVIQGDATVCSWDDSGIQLTSDRA